MRNSAILTMVSLCGFAHAQGMAPDVYFTSGWCPRSDEVASISEHLSLTMNGCCILKGSPRSALGVPAGALSPWKDRVIPNFYPGARCDGVVMTAAEEPHRAALMEAKAAKETEAAKTQADTDRKAELWPPTSHEFCLSAAASGDLARRSVSLSECYELAKTKGARAVSERAKAGGYFIREFGLWDVNSAGGVEPHAKFVNPNTEVDIKYIDLQIVMYNAVGDLLRSDIGNRVTGLVRMTGPLGNDDGEKSAQWDPVWYNHSAACLKIQSVRVEFMNRKALNFSGGSLAKALHPKLRNECGVRRRG